MSTHVLLLLLLLLLFATVATIATATATRVFTGTVTLSTNAVQRPIGANNATVDVQRSFVYHTFASAAGGGCESLVTVSLAADGAAVVVRRGLASVTSAIVVSYTVVELATARYGSVVVARGESSVSGSGRDTTVDLVDADALAHLTARTGFYIASLRCAEANDVWSRDFFYTVQLVATGLRFSRTTKASASHHVAAQWVGSPNLRLHLATTSLASAATSATAALGTSVADVRYAFVAWLSFRRGPNTNTRSRNAVAELVNNDTVRVERGAAGDSLGEMRVSVVESTNAAIRALPVRFDITDGDALASYTIDADADNADAYANVWRGAPHFPITTGMFFSGLSTDASVASLAMYTSLTTSRAESPCSPITVTATRLNTVGNATVVATVLVLDFDATATVPSECVGAVGGPPVAATTVTAAAMTVTAAAAATPVEQPTATATGAARAAVSRL